MLTLCLLMGDLLKLSLIRYKRQDLDWTAYATFISSNRLVLDATVKIIKLITFNGVDKSGTLA